MKETSLLVGSKSDGEPRDNIIHEGDIIIIYGGIKFIKRITLNSGETFACRFGEFLHSSFIGRKYGERVLDRKGTKWVVALHPTPELWTMSLSHRTQVLYSTDANTVAYMLDLGPGKTVLEAGTGSGSLTATLARSIFPDGRLITHDFHQDRAEAAKEEFNEAGMESIINCVHRDVISNGFVTDDNSADAIFLDLPSPWSCIDDGHVMRSLKPNGRFCSFSPCIEQVQRTCESLRNTKEFTDIVTMECLLRPFQMVNKREKKTIPVDRGGRLPSKTPSDNSNGEENSNGDKSEESNGSKNNKGKKRKTMESDDDNLFPDSDEVVAVPIPDIRGHTGYLTFAQRLVL
eukprot:gb/GECH01013586.1/.p1 GENE.gb/GECH01013586.1/~~gb/GECH01013586.1/.p1  ORF type:complete len:346 (+),score=77.23 gb/GECH01013586.1/:1-1038(+)